MENEFNNTNSSPVSNLLGIGIEEEVRNKFHTIITWSKITAVAGFVNMALNIAATINTYSNTYTHLDPTWIIITNVVTLVITFFLNFFLLRFSGSLKNSLDNEDQAAFTMAAMQLKAYMRMLGILLIVTILLGIVSSLFVMSAFRHF